MEGMAPVSSRPAPTPMLVLAGGIVLMLAPLLPTVVQTATHLRAMAPLGSPAAAAQRQAQQAPQEAQDALPRGGDRAGTMFWTGETGVY